MPLQSMMFLTLIVAMIRFVDCRCGHGDLVTQETGKALEALMGGAASQVIIWDLKRRTFSGEKIHQRPEDFFRGLYSVLGPGDVIVAKKIYDQMSEIKELKHCRFLKFLQRRAVKLR